MKKILVVVFWLFSTLSVAQSFPNKPIVLVVPYSAGGPTDRVARDLANIWRTQVGQQVIVDNTVGSGGLIGANRVKNAKPDGYTVLIHNMGVSTYPVLYPSSPINFTKDLIPLGQIADVPMILLANKQVPVKNIKELLAWIKKRDGQVSIGHAGTGSTSHLAALLMQKQLNTHLLMVPYKGSALALTDLIGGQIDLLWVQTTSLQGGIIKEFTPLAVAMNQRLTAYQQLPTMNESGFKNFHIPVWHGIWVPAGTPQAVQDHLSKTLIKAVKMPQYNGLITSYGAILPFDFDAKSLENLVMKGTSTWTPIIKESITFVE